MDGPKPCWIFCLCGGLFGLIAVGVATAYLVITQNENLDLRSQDWARDFFADTQFVRVALSSVLARLACPSPAAPRRPRFVPVPRHQPTAEPPCPVRR